MKSGTIKEMEVQKKLSREHYIIFHIAIHVYCQEKGQKLAGSGFIS